MTTKPALAATDEETEGRDVLRGGHGDDEEAAVVPEEGGALQGAGLVQDQEVAFQRHRQRVLARASKPNWRRSLVHGADDQASDDMDTHATVVEDASERLFVPRPPCVTCGDLKRRRESRRVGRRSVRWRVEVTRAPGIGQPKSQNTKPPTSPSRTRADSRTWRTQRTADARLSLLALRTEKENWTSPGTATVGKMRTHVDEAWELRLSATAPRPSVAVPRAIGKRARKESRDRNA